METRNARFWRALEKKAKIWMENSSDEPSFVMLYLLKPNESRPVPQIKFFGSSNMKKFVEDVEVRRKFVEACEKPIEVEEPKKLKVFHPHEPDTYTMDNLRILASCLVREEGWISITRFKEDSRGGHTCISTDLWYFVAAPSASEIPEANRMKQKVTGVYVQRQECSFVLS